MGTEFCLYLEPEGAEPWEEITIAERTLVQAVFAEVDRVEAIFNRFDPASEISRLNRLAALGPVVTDPEVFSLLWQGKQYGETSGGAFDLALGAVSQAWGFAGHAPHLPENKERITAEAAAGMAMVDLDPEWRTVAFRRPGVELDLGAFAKGYAVDGALEVLRAAGAEGLIDAGHSSIGAVGEAFTEGWTVEIPLPRLDGQAAEPVDTIRLGCRAMGSSGIMEQKFTEGSRVYSHLFDPRSLGREEARAETGKGRMLQTTVLAGTAAEADALSTALFVLGPEEGLALADRYSVAVLWLLEEAGRPQWSERNWPHRILPWGDERK